MVALPTQDPRAQRAVRDFSRYEFRAVEIRTSRGPIPCVYVTAPAKKDGSRTCYTVALNPAENSARCNCPDFQRRQCRCKHVFMALAFLNVSEPRELGSGDVTGTPAPEQLGAPIAAAAAPVETPEQRRARILRDRELWD